MVALNGKAEGRNVSLAQDLWDALEQHQTSIHAQSLSEALRDVIVPRLKELGYLKT